MNGLLFLVTPFIYNSINNTEIITPCYSFIKNLKIFNKMYFYKIIYKYINIITKMN